MIRRVDAGDVEVVDEDEDDEDREGLTSLEEEEVKAVAGTVCI